MLSYDMFVVAGIVSAVLGSLAFLPYIYDTIFGKTRPLKSTWLIWTVLSSISLFSNVAEGATTSIWYIGTQAGFTALIFLLAVPFGTGKYLSAWDGQALFLAACGLVSWYVTKDAVYALTLSIFISAVGGFVTISKAYHDPDSENWVCWFIAALAALLGIVSVGTFDLVLLAYPIYLFFLYLAIFMAIVLGQENTQTAKSQSVY